MAIAGKSHVFCWKNKGVSFRWWRTPLISHSLTIWRLIPRKLSWGDATEIILNQMNGWLFHGNLMGPPPMPRLPPRNSRPYWGTMKTHWFPLIRPAFFGPGEPLDCFPWLDLARPGHQFGGQHGLSTRSLAFQAIITHRDWYSYRHFGLIFQAFSCTWKT